MIIYALSYPKGSIERSSSPSTLLRYVSHNFDIIRSQNIPCHNHNVSQSRCSSHWLKQRHRQCHLPNACFSQWSQAFGYLRNLAFRRRSSHQNQVSHFSLCTLVLPHPSISRLSTSAHASKSPANQQLTIM